MAETFSVDQQEYNIYTHEGFQQLSDMWTKAAWEQQLSYETVWAGVPVIQTPEDLMMMQELLWKVRPDVLIETGTAHGGSAIFYASIFELIGKGKVVSIDVDLRRYNRQAIKAHPFSKRIELINGSSTDISTYSKVKAEIGERDVVMVALDSDHSYAHVNAELNLYSMLVTKGSYIVVFDTVLGSLWQAPGAKKWAEVGTPDRAVEEFIKLRPDFQPDYYYNRLKTTYCEGGFLRREA